MIKLDYIQSNEAIEMASHYLQVTLSDTQKGRMGDIMKKQVGCYT